MRKNLKYNLSWTVLAVAVYLGIFVLKSAGLLSGVVEDTLSLIGINIILAVGLNLIIGFSGQFSLGHAGFMAIGSYATAIFTQIQPTYAGFLLSILIGVGITIVVALIVGIPTLRLKGDYLAIATLGIAEIIRILIVNGKDDLSQGIFATGGAAGIFGIVDYANWEVIYIFMVLTTVIIANFIHSGTGRTVLSIREDEIAAEAMGVNSTKVKVLAFVLGAATASIAGSLHASYIQTIVPGDFGFMKSVDILIIVVFGGIGSLTGSFVAAILLGVLNHVLRNVQAISDYRMIVYALALVIIMIFKPGGLLGKKEMSMKKLFQRIGKGGKEHASVDR